MRDESKRSLLIDGGAACSVEVIAPQSGSCWIIFASTTLSIV